jgi:hypothetical protein
MKKHYAYIILLFVLVSLFYSVQLFASEKSDAAALMKQCEDGIKLLEVPIKNFGDEKDIARFNEGANIIKLGKAKLAQAKYAEAKAKFNEYLTMQTELYKILGEKYIKRTQELIDLISVELADYVSDAVVLEAFAKANHYLDAARTKMGEKDYPLAVASCRRSKKFLFDIYIQLKSALPDVYAKDNTDVKNEIFK